METIIVNNILKDDIVKVSSNLLPFGVEGDTQSVRTLHNSMALIVDDLGKRSTLEQGLTKIITSSEKLQNTPSQSIYLLKDSSANGGKGEVIGLLKVGRKHLYLFDEKEVVREVEPLCVLDFFVRPEYQRHGHGRRLFDYMLQSEGVRPEQMAVDGPSPKIERFLAKYYGLNKLVRQNNNFAIAPTFFDSIKELGNRSVPPPTEALIGRFAARKPSSSISDVIHGDGSGCYSGSKYNTTETPKRRNAPEMTSPAVKPLEVPMTPGGEACGESPLTDRGYNNTTVTLKPSYERQRLFVTSPVKHLELEIPSSDANLLSPGNLNSAISPGVSPRAKARGETARGEIAPGDVP